VLTLEELFEASSPLARKLAAHGPYSSSQEIIARARELLPTLSPEEKIATLNTHPRIGEDPKRMSARSRNEQGSDVIPELAQLNAEYEQRFGFRFVVFVNRRSKREIAQDMRQRLQRSPEHEMETGLEAIVDIAEDRLRR
jgi:2-oxo-4-hydroxy-4-carboxy--5-ureidoimidazoline (OHCU) decarboxylase